MGRYYDPALIYWLPVLALAYIAYRLLPAPWSNIVGVTLMWSPLVVLQIALENYVVAIIIVVVAYFIVKDCWND